MSNNNNNDNSTLIIAFIAVLILAYMYYINTQTKEIVSQTPPTQTSMTLKSPPVMKINLVKETSEFFGGVEFLDANYNKYLKVNGSVNLPSTDTEAAMNFIQKFTVYWIASDEDETILKSTELENNPGQTKEFSLNTENTNVDLNGSMVKITYTINNKETEWGSTNGIEIPDDLSQFDANVPIATFTLNSLNAINADATGSVAYILQDFKFGDGLTGNLRNYPGVTKSTITKVKVNENDFIYRIENVNKLYQDASTPINPHPYPIDVIIQKAPGTEGDNGFYIFTQPGFPSLFMKLNTFSGVLVWDGDPENPNPLDKSKHYFRIVQAMNPILLNKIKNNIESVYPFCGQITHKTKEIHSMKKAFFTFLDNYAVEPTDSNIQPGQTSLHDIFCGNFKTPGKDVSCHTRGTKRGARIHKSIWEEHYKYVDERNGWYAQDHMCNGMRSKVIINLHNENSNGDKVIEYGWGDLLSTENLLPDGETI